jgi:site-specific DNA-methyltransferase (adenine-specific)
MSYTIHHGDCIEVAKRFADEGFKCHSIVTDPPYGLGFMGKAWDKSVAFDPKTWEE